MIFKQTTTVTEIEADARELRECQSLGQNLTAMMNRIFQNHEPIEDDEDLESEEAEDDQPA